MAKVDNNSEIAKLIRFKEDQKVSVTGHFNGIDTTITGYIFSLRQVDDKLQRLEIYGKTHTGGSANTTVYNDDKTLMLLEDVKVANPHADDNYSIPENLAL